MNDFMGRHFRGGIVPWAIRRDCRYAECTGLWRRIAKHRTPSLSNPARNQGAVRHAAPSGAHELPIRHWKADRDHIMHRHSFGSGFASKNVMAYYSS